MATHTKIAIVLVIWGIAGIIAYKYLAPYFESEKQQNTSDAVGTKGNIVIGVDNWIGYFPLCSPEMRKRMRQSGYVLECKDDKADYPQRMKLLKKGKLNFAVATVDSYLLNGHAVNYPGTIVSVLDESKGGDAIVAWEDKISSIEQLKTVTDYKIALTPASPSEHLLKSISVHFDIPRIRKDKSIRFEANGSEDALNALLKKNVSVAVLWEPDVSRAISEKGIKKLLGTEQTEKLIVDILIVNREFANDKPEAVSVLLTSYFRTLKFYSDDLEKFVNDAAQETGLSKSKVQTLFKGVKWVNLLENAQQWYGVVNKSAGGNEALVDTIESVANILIDSGDFATTPIPANDPYRLTNSRFLTDLYNKTFASTQFGVAAHTSQGGSSLSGLEKPFSALAKSEWAGLKEVATLRIRPIIFQSGTDFLTLEGKTQLDLAAENLKHYPHFRVLIKGHTSMRGDAQANTRLSQARANAVSEYLKSTYNINVNRIMAVGYGGNKPLNRQDGESLRKYNYRLSRVEIALVAEAL